jgi:hypothetical protein
MSKIALSGNASGTGTFTFAAPGTNTDRTLTLPDASGTLATTADIPAAGGMTLLGTLATTSGSSVTLSGLTLTDYKQLSVVCNSVSGSNGTTDWVRINGNNLFIVGFNNQTQVGLGGAIIDLASGIFWATTQFTTAANGNSYGGASGLTTASTSITFTISAGTFDAGSIRIYGVK